MTLTCYAVVKAYTWDKDEYLGVFTERAAAEREAKRLNVKHDSDDDDPTFRDYRVWELPLNSVRT